MKNKFKINNISLLIAVLLLVVMFVAGANLYDRFGSVSTVLNLFNDNAYLIVVAVGMTFVLLTGGIDISVASTLAFTGVFSAFLLEKGWPAAVVIPLVLLIGTLVGCIQGYAIHEFNIAPFLVTLVGQFFMRGMCAVISTVSIPINNEFFKMAALKKISFVLSSGGRPKLYYYVFVALFIVFLAWYVLKFTRSSLCSRKQRAERTVYGAECQGRKNRCLWDQRILRGAGRSAFQLLYTGRIFSPEYGA